MYCSSRADVADGPSTSREPQLNTAGGAAAQERGDVPLSTYSLLAPNADFPARQMTPVVEQRTRASAMSGPAAETEHPAAKSPDHLPRAREDVSRCKVASAVAAGMRQSWTKNQDGMLTAAGTADQQPWHQASLQDQARADPITAARSDEWHPGRTPSPEEQQHTAPANWPMQELPVMLELLAAHPVLAGIDAESVMESGLSHYFLPHYAAYMRATRAQTAAPDADKLQVADAKAAAKDAARKRSLARMRIRSFHLLHVAPFSPL